MITRELIYTGLTRAKKEAIIVGDENALCDGIEARVERAGRLSQRLNRIQ